MRAVSALGLGLLGLGLVAGSLAGQEVPEYTRARQKAVAELLDACRKAEAFTVEGQGERAVARIDEKKVRAVVAARRDRVDAELVDALLAGWVRAREQDRALLVALLRACGEEKDDERVRGLAAFLTAKADEQAPSRQAEAVRGYAQAVRHFARARETVWQATSLNNLGSVLHDQEEYEQALKHYRQALEIRQALFPRDKYPHGHPLLATSLNNLGFVLHHQGEYEQALKHFRLALEMYQALFPRDKYPQGHPSLAGSLTNLGGVLQDQGEHEQALKHLRLALEMRQHEVERLASSAPEDRALNFAASLPLTRDGLLSVAAHVEGSATAAYAAVWPSRSAVTRVFERRHLALLAASASPRVQALHARLLVLRQERARLLLAPLPVPRARGERLEQLPREIEQVEQELLPLLPALARAEQRARSSPQQLQKGLPARTAFVDLLRYVHFEQSPTIKGRKGQRRTPRYVAFVLMRERLSRVDLGAAKPLEEALDLWRRALLEGSDSAAEHGARVRRLVWEPLAKELAGSDTVYLAPDGRLTQLPWSALPGPQPDSLLLEQQSLALVPHGAFLLDRLTAPAVKAEDRPVLLAVGGVRYDDRPRTLDPETVARLQTTTRAPVVADKSGLWKRLAGTETELERVQGLSGRFTLRTLTGAEASTQRLLLELPRARLAHLATHGFFADARFRSVLQLDESLFERWVRDDGSTRRRIGAGSRSPLVLSGLVLAGANRADTPDRGILSADDLVSLDLRHLDLAVLSACETGLGEVGGGEGVFGLQRAFHIVGCQNVVASLWKVDDEATAALMVLFYRYLGEEKLPPIQALRRAQLALYHNPGQIAKWSQGTRGINLKEVYTGTGKPPAEVKPSGKTPPRLWAAFTLSGLGR